MDSKIALDKIKDIELESKTIIDSAKKTSQKILNETLAKKEQIIKAAYEKIALDAKKLKSESEAEAEKEASLIKERSEEEMKLLRKKSEFNFDKALEFIKSKTGS